MGRTARQLGRRWGFPRRDAALGRHRVQVAGKGEDDVVAMNRGEAQQPRFLRQAGPPRLGGQIITIPVGASSGTATGTAADNVYAGDHRVGAVVVREREQYSALGRRLLDRNGLRPARSVTTPIPVRVCDDAATADFIGRAQADAEGFRNQRMAKSPACESPIHGKPRSRMSDTIGRTTKK